MDKDGALVATYRYYPFGERYSGSATPHQYTGQQRDPETGLDYFGARYLASTSARWMTVDPVLGDLSNPQRLNRYGYVLNDPVNFVDSLGQEPVRIICRPTFRWTWQSPEVGYLVLSGCRHRHLPKE